MFTLNPDEAVASLPLTDGDESASVIGLMKSSWQKTRLVSAGQLINYSCVGIMLWF